MSCTEMLYFTTLYASKPCCTYTLVMDKVGTHKDYGNNGCRSLSALPPPPCNIMDVD